MQDFTPFPKVQLTLGPRPGKKSLLRLQELRLTHCCTLLSEREGAPATEGEIERVCTAYRLFLHRVEAASSRPTCANRLFYFAIRRSLFRLTFGTVRTVR